MNNSFDEIFNNGWVRIALTGALSILALFLLSETIATAQNFGRPSVPATDTVTVTGNGQATMAPDVARISFTVQNTKATVGAAQDATTKQANAALEFVSGQGIADKDVKTLSYNISPQYSYPSCPPGVYCPNTNPTVTGYQVSETVQVTIRDLSTVGAFVSGLGNVSVQNISGPNFGLEDSTAGYNAARADAINKAKDQAGLLASQLGVHLGKIVSFSESSGGYPAPMYASMDSVGGGAKGAAVPNIPTGENSYNASVSITYEIR